MGERVLCWSVVLVGLLGCGGEPPPPDPGDCKSGICVSGGASDGAGRGGAAGSMNGGRGGAPTGGNGSSTGGTGGTGGSGAGVGGGAGEGSGGTDDVTGGTGGRGGGSTGGGSATGGTGGTGGGSGSGGAVANGGSAGSAVCEGEACGPVADLDMDFYQCNVEPIFDRSCAMLGCHGSEERPFRIYARGRLRNDQDLTTAQNPAANGCLRNSTVNLAENGTGTIMCEGWTRHTALEWQKNFESSRAFMRENMNPEDSELLMQAKVGGRPHVGVHPFREGDASYTMILRWLSGERLGSVCNPEFN
jgi:hypothetical protein